MNVPLKWLADHVDLTGISLPDLVDRLTIAGLEVAAVRLIGLPVPEGLRAKRSEVGPVWERDKIITAQIREITKHPNADSLKVVQLDVGNGQTKQVITGAPNIAVGESGQKVILGLSGSQYWTRDKKDPTKGKELVTLKPKELRGIPNDAMCMSDFELGISEESDGIILLEPEAPVGVPAVDVLGDAVLEIDVLPNMARCLSMVGIAREVAAIFGRKACVPNPVVKAPKGKIDGKVKVEIVDAKRSARYSATMIEGVRVGPSPAMVQRRLKHAGMRPISNIVDITNYAMLEWGQPLHAFDYDLLVKRAGEQSPTIVVRSAKPGEKLVTLDKQERELTADDLVIADTVGAIALAGVMGGLETEVTDSTTTILLESASFDFVSVRRTAHKFTLFSEASTRFSRGVHPEIVIPAAKHAAQLMVESGGGHVLDGIVDNYAAPLPVQVVNLPKAEIRRLVGIDFPDADVERVLSALDFQLKPTADGWSVTVPSTRLDIHPKQSGAADLIEELARIYGYDRLPSTMLSGSLPAQKGNRSLELEESVRDLLARTGLRECITYRFSSHERELPLGVSGQAVEMKNPVSPDRAILRRTLLTNLLDVAETNLKHTATVKLFELGPVFLPQPGERLPAEPRRLSLVLAGRRKTEAWDDPLGTKPATLDFFDLKGIVETIVAGLHLKGVSYKAATQSVWLHPGRSAEVLIGDKTVGAFGELHPKAISAFRLGDRAILAAEFDLEAIFALVPERFGYTPIAQTPPALRDVAVVVDEAVTHETVSSEIRAAGGGLLTNVRLFDVYTGDSIPCGKKSLAYALMYQSDKTLNDKEIDKAHKKIEDRLKHVLKATIRGQ